jgi:hypothetical protein
MTWEKEREKNHSQKNFITGIHPSCRLPLLSTSSIELAISCKDKKESERGFSASFVRLQQQRLPIVR